MSADMQKRNTLVVVPPQPVSDRSIIDSVTDFISDVTQSTAYQTDQKTQVLWVRFDNYPTTDMNVEQPGVNDPMSNSILLVLGYTNGIQVWSLPANGEAVEVLSWRHGLVKCLKILPTPLILVTKEKMDHFFYKRPLIALCEAGSNPQFQYCSVNFISLKDGDQVKNIKFKNPVVDIFANRTSVVLTFTEKIAVFDLLTLEDRLTITTCQVSPGLTPNPIALGSRWIAYSEKAIHMTKKSGGGFNGDGEISYTATVLNAAKTLGKSLKDLGGQVAAGLTGAATTNLSFSASGNPTESIQYGVVTILDIKNPVKENTPGNPISLNGVDPVIAHFVAHKDPIVAMGFDFSGMLLLTADKKGHNFHIFRIHPHPVSSALAAVHHLYTLHRGDTTAKVQDIVFSLDSRYVAVLTTRGTTHLFAITPYGGEIGLRTHSQHHVVNKLSRFHRSAGILIAEGRSNSPVNFSEHSIPYQTAYNNPRLPPYTCPTILFPLAQIRQPSCTATTSGNATSTKNTTTRQRNYSSSELDANHLKIAAIFGKDRSYLLNSLPVRDMSKRRRVADSLFIITSTGQLVQYDIDTKPASNIPKEKISDETPFELLVEAKAQWSLLRNDAVPDVTPPLTSNNPLLNEYEKLNRSAQVDEDDDNKEDKWLSQVEIITHSGPHRRLWMGPQFQFKTYSIPSGGSLSGLDEQSTEIGSLPIHNTKTNRTNSVNMPIPGKSLSIESGTSSTEQSPRLSDAFTLEHQESEHPHFVQGETQIKEDIADAMRESPAVNHEVPGGESSSTNSSCYGSTQNLATFRGTLKIVNPQGTVTTINDDLEKISNHNAIQLHENCDETLFRPVVTVISDYEHTSKEIEITKQEVNNTNVLQNAKLIVPIYNENDVSNNKFFINSEAKKTLSKTKKAEIVQEKPMLLNLNSSSEKESFKTVKNELSTLEPTQNAACTNHNQTILVPLCADDSYETKQDIMKTNLAKFDDLKESEITRADGLVDEIRDKFSLDLKFPSLEPLDPIENFVDTFDKINNEEEEEKPSNDNTEENVWNNFNKKKLIFAMCTSLRDDSRENQNLEILEPHESQDSDYKSLETEETAIVKELEVEAPQSEDTTSTGSDDNTEENSGILSDIGKPREEDDEELRPLINNRRKETSLIDKSCNVNDASSVQNTPTHTTGNSKRKSRRKRK